MSNDAGSDQVMMSRRALMTTLALAGVGSSGSANAAPSSLVGAPTNIEGSADRLVSYRHQSRMWKTSDGAVHLLANVGVQQDGGSLRLYSSGDNGLTWSERANFAGTDDTSTSDGFLANDNLFVTYSTSSQTVLVVFLTYDPQAAVWSVGNTETAFSSPTISAISPAMSRDGNGRYWLAFTARDAQGNNFIKMVRRVSTAEGWVDTGFVFGESDSASIERAGRPVAVSGGMGIVYTVRQNVYWARRSNNWNIEQPWARELVYQNVAPDTDPYGTHFNVLVDGASNVHVATMDGSRLLYLRLNHSTQIWSRKALTRPRNVAYMKLARTATQLVLIYNDRTNLAVLQSGDAGLSWTTTHRLLHQGVGTGGDFTNPRVETLATPAGAAVPVLQQYVESGVQRLLHFEVPVVSGLAWGADSGSVVEP